MKNIKHTLKDLFPISQNIARLKISRSQEPPQTDGFSYQVLVIKSATVVQASVLPSLEASEKYLSFHNFPSATIFLLNLR